MDGKESKDIQAHFEHDKKKSAIGSANRDNYPLPGVPIGKHLLARFFTGDFVFC